MERSRSFDQSEEGKITEWETLPLEMFQYDIAMMESMQELKPKHGKYLTSSFNSFLLIHFSLHVLAYFLLPQISAA